MGRYVYAEREPVFGQPSIRPTSGGAGSETMGSHVLRAIIHRLNPRAKLPPMGEVQWSNAVEADVWRAFGLPSMAVTGSEQALTMLTAALEKRDEWLVSRSAEGSRPG